ncbi:heavy metal sensor histidine kinase [Bordetella bronchiseptica]|uniref:heavy metal sensor histidine kinase n=1 Tax=Bordetella bronchiseptica TaxID=518 RepID=UPI000461EF5D|nr:heavy metal sensor histidine kinase [Bordetella bronchiseptica]KDD16397.1 heavy metal sensor kinase [Bordetella bronchiseptica MBORD707]
MRLRTPSMQRRLTLWLGVIALLASSLAGALLFWTLKQEVQRQEITEARGKAELIEHLVGMQSHTSRALSDMLDGIQAGHGHLGIWITSPDGTLRYGNATPEVLSVTDGDEVLLRNADDTRMRGVRLTLPGPPEAGATLTVAVNTLANARFLYAYGTALLLICALWIGATVVLAAWAVRRTLAPVRRLSGQAASIQPEHLDVRLPVVGIDRELSDLVASFNRTLDRLQEAYQQMEGFNADVAHELRTPLATLINGAQVTLSSPRSAEELREALTSNLEELEDLKTLVNDMLFLARADRGEQAADLAPARLEQEALRVAEYFEATLEARALHVAVQGSATCAANPGLVRRALANLLANAIRATPRGATITVRCAALPDGAARLTVHNPGPPIPAADLPRIFDRFFRSGGARPPRGEGHGLGLAIVRAIARMHNGGVTAASGPAGTEIGFSLGARPAQDDKRVIRATD